MNQEQLSLSTWQIVLFVVLGIGAAIVIAFLLAQVDTFQRRSFVPANGPQINDPEATIAAGELSTIYLQGEARPTPFPQITPTAIEPSSAELIPTEEAPAKAGATCDQIPDKATVYIVKSGETLASIANKFGVSEEAIRLMNCLPHDRLIKGQQLFVPQDIGFAAPAKPPCERPPNWKNYKITSGDTLPELARAYGTTVSHIMKANCLESGELVEQGEIFLPVADQDHTLPGPDN